MALSLERRIGKLAQKKNERRKKQKVQRYINVANILVFFASVIAFFYSVGNPKHTFVDWRTIFIIGTISAILLSIPAKAIVKEFGIGYILLLGNLSVAVFYFINIQFAHPQTKVVKRPVIEKTHGGRYGGPGVELKYESITKRFSVDNTQLDSANYVTLTIKQGYFGYAFIDDYKISAE